MSESFVKSQKKLVGKGKNPLVFDMITLTNGQVVEIGADFVTLYDNDPERSVLDLIERHQD